MPASRKSPDQMSVEELDAVIVDLEAQTRAWRDIRRTEPATADSEDWYRRACTALAYHRNARFPASEGGASAASLRKRLGETQARLVAAQRRIDRLEQISPRSMELNAFHDAAKAMLDRATYISIKAAARKILTERGELPTD